MVGVSSTGMRGKMHRVSELLVAACWFDVGTVGRRHITKVTGAHIFVFGGPTVLQVGWDALCIALGAILGKRLVAGLGFLSTVARKNQTRRPS